MRKWGGWRAVSAGARPGGPGGRVEDTRYKRGIIGCAMGRVNLRCGHPPCDRECHCAAMAARGGGKFLRAWEGSL